MECDQCGVDFFPGDTGWTACGDCLADSTEWMLMGGLAKTERRPIRRAEVKDPGEITVIVEPLPKAA